MTTWYDARAGRYRASLPHKIVYVWGWRLIRWVMYRLPEETAHHMAIRGIWLMGLVDRVWSWLVIAVVVPLVIGLRLLAFLPGFSWEPDPPHAEKDH